MGSEGLQERYINPYTDFGFKKLFGTELNKELLISFLNALLQGEQTVKNVTYLNTEHLGTQEIDRRAVSIRQILMQTQGSKQNNHYFCAFN